jgi:hypothetical protein
MKTEITIDDRLAIELKEAAELSQISFDQAVIRALYAGVTSLPHRSDPKRFVTQPHDFGIPLDDPKAALAKLEEEEDLERYRRGGG